MKPILFVLLTLVIFSACQSGSTEENENVENAGPVTPAIKYEEVDYFLHDTSLFTEGLLIHDGLLFESTGSPDKGRKSLIGYNDLKTGAFIKKVELPHDSLFGEGIVFFKDKLYQLTYKNHIGFIYDAHSYRKTGQFPIAKEGWGLTTDGASIIMSDGTDTLNYVDADGYTIHKKLPVTENGAKRDSLNELEYIKGYIYANIWLTNNIVKIDPANGKVVGKLDLSTLAFKAALTTGGDALNGIAYDSTTSYIYVTGKLWPHIHQLKMSQ
ncbi:glutaminyl-peptide cyclotransferase [Niastella yeongjuensis]|uniref:glutaminyl-peptide cyclotransferase n=1 Tax=Niastella yeongjuensis TaxID=354355 RepID=UPI0013FD3062|nr:glutaminyl-peptide cyclotransferase [Niastella yeongjuensis]